MNSHLVGPQSFTPPNHQNDKWAYITPAFYPAMSNRGWMLVQSASKSNIPLYAYGLGEQYKGMIDGKLARLAVALRELQEDGFTHAVVLDCEDNIILNDTAIVRYYGMGEPHILISSEPNCHPDPSLAGDIEYVLSTDIDDGYPNAGQFMGHINILRCVTHYLLDRYNGYSDDQERWCWLAADGGFNRFGVRMDTDRYVFLNMNWPFADKDVVDDETGGTPIIHFSGGYVDRVTGRDAVMMPVWTALKARKQWGERT